jgi:hypothetical protein
MSKVCNISTDYRYSNVKKPHARIMQHKLLISAATYRSTATMTFLLSFGRRKSSLFIIEPDATGYWSGRRDERAGRSERGRGHTRLHSGCVRER